MHPTILLADEHDDSRTVYRHALEHFGYRVVDAADGGEAVRMAQLHPPALALISLTLPLLDGWQTLRALRLDPSLARIPALALTAYLGRDDAERAGREGFLGFLLKPVGPVALCAEVGRLVGAVAPAADPALALP